MQIVASNPDTPQGGWNKEDKKNGNVQTRDEEAGISVGMKNTMAGVGTGQRPEFFAREWAKFPEEWHNLYL